MNLLVITAMVVLDCTEGECTLGNGGRRYQTADLEEANALRMLELHVRTHEPGRREQQVGVDVVARVKPETVPRPKLSKGISEDKYVYFDRQWTRYKRSQLAGIRDEMTIRDQLLACCNEDLMQDLENTFGTQLDRKSEVELMADMRKLAVVAQNNLVNVVRLRSLEQDRDESGRSFLARLKGLGAVCKLSVKCSCVPSTSVSYADEEILHCFVKGLADEDIRRRVLGKVEEMDLETTVRFVEAEESGKKANVFLDRGTADVEVVSGYKKSQREQTLASGVKPNSAGSEEPECWFCNKRGHGLKPNFEKKKTDCPAFDKTCKVCGLVGHFAKTKACAKKDVKVEKVVLMQHETTVDKK